MKESYGEGVANHTGPASCVGYSRGGGEALAGVRAGRVLSREILSQLQGAHALDVVKGNIVRVASARYARTLRGRRPRARTETPCTGTGRSLFAFAMRVAWAAAESPRTQADDERIWEVGQPRGVPGDRHSYRDRLLPTVYSFNLEGIPPVNVSTRFLPLSFAR
jgi:hypothetical protein